MVDQAFAAGDNEAANQKKLEGAYDYIVVGAGASGAIVAGELSKTGAKVLVVESGGADTAHDQQSKHLVLQRRRSVGLEAADRAGSPTEQPKIQYGPWARSGWRQLHQCVGVVAAWSGTMTPGSGAARRHGASRTCCRHTRPRRIGKAALTSGAVPAVQSTFASRVIPIRRPQPS
jgi:choline dehydrogenase-like flavoprotein